MKFGVCTEIENINTAQGIGFDYIEVNISAIAALSDEGFREKVSIARGANIACECFNILFPHTISLLGAGATNWNEIEIYLHRAFERAKLLGGKIIVFGSGKCRSYPQDICFSDAHRRLAEIITKIGKIAADYNLIIAVEPLNRNESNMICTVAEGAMLTAQINSENVCLLADGYHMLTDNEHMGNIKRAGKLAHAHIATKNGRKYPVEHDELIYEFFAQLNSIGYDERISIEGGTNDFEKDARVALALLRKYTLSN